MIRFMLSDEKWARIEGQLPGKPTDKGGRAVDNRLFVEAILYIARVVVLQSIGLNENN
ncbi:hypothetical protein CCP3SC5AM1_340003 [Gammaproteobacteria bacterium]